MAAPNQVWLITGANAGFGLLLAQLVLSKGHTVVATARSSYKFPAALRDHAKADLVDTLIDAPLSDITALVDAAVTRHSRLDVLVNNAGFAQMGAVEEVSETEARYQFDVNFFGLLHFSKAVIPHMRRQGSGTIVNLSSGAGILGHPGGALYCATKFAVEGLSESMAVELRPFGLRIVLVEPGIFRTDFLGRHASGGNVSQAKEGYTDMGAVSAGMHGKQPGDPEKGAQRMYEVVTSTGMAAGLDDQLRFVLGNDCQGMFKMKIESLSQTVEKMEKIAASTDY